MHPQFGRTEAKTEESRVLRSVCRSKFFGLYGAIAQLVEQRTENPCVTGSIPVGTTKKTARAVFFCIRGKSCFPSRFHPLFCIRGKFCFPSRCHSLFAKRLFIRYLMPLSSLHIIARARNGFSEKFGIPRQSREESMLLTRIVFEPDYRIREALRGIEGFSHLWLLWGFSANKQQEQQWSPTVRPPRLGGNQRMGVFATRSPYRPNPIGLTSVKLLRVEDTAEGLVLVVSGADLLDGTPIYDIKPYLRYSDAHADAIDGFAQAPFSHRLEVVWQAPEAELRLLSPNHKAAFEEILSQDPRPAYQDDPNRTYGLVYDGAEVHFRVIDTTLYVDHINSKGGF